MGGERGEVEGDLAHHGAQSSSPILLHLPRRAALEEGTEILQCALERLEREWQAQRGWLPGRLSPGLDLAGPELRRRGEDLARRIQGKFKRL